MLRLLVGGHSLRVKRSKTAFVAKKGPPSHGHTPREQNFDGRVQPDHWDIRGSQKFRRARLCVGAATQSEHDGFVKLKDAAERRAQLVGFDLAKSRLSEALEDLWDAQPGGGLDTVIQIDKAPGKLTREQRPDSGFAGAHEAREAKHLYPRLGGTRKWWLRHEMRMDRPPKLRSNKPAAAGSRKS